MERGTRKREGLIWTYTKTRGYEEGRDKSSAPNTPTHFLSSRRGKRTNKRSQKNGGKNERKNLMKNNMTALKRAKGLIGGGSEHKKGKEEVGCPPKKTLIGGRILGIVSQTRNKRKKRGAPMGGTRFQSV